jgi:hypothetical protein
VLAGSGVGAGDAPPAEGGAYNRHASLPARGGAFAIPHLEDAAPTVTLDTTGNPAVIADYGSSQGRNSFAPLHAALPLRRLSGASLVGLWGNRNRHSRTLSARGHRLVDVLRLVERVPGSWQETACRRHGALRDFRRTGTSEDLIRRRPTFSRRERRHCDWSGRRIRLDK